MAGPAHDQCDARPTVTYPAAGHHRHLTGAELYCFVTEAHVCEQLAQRKLPESGTAKIQTRDLLSVESNVVTNTLPCVLQCHCLLHSFTAWCRRALQCNAISDVTQNAKLTSIGPNVMRTYCLTRCQIFSTVKCHIHPLLIITSLTTASYTS